jgi:hypothetical protein
MSTRLLRLDRSTRLFLYAMAFAHSCALGCGVWRAGRRHGRGICEYVRTRRVSHFGTTVAFIRVALVSASRRAERGHRVSNSLLLSPCVYSSSCIVNVLGKNTE